MSGALAGHYELILAGQPGPARVRLRQFLDAEGDDGRALFLMGLSHHRERAYPKAVPWFERAMAATPPYPPAAHFLGWAHYHNGNATASRAAFEQHLRLDPNEGDTHFGLGVLALERGDLDEADARLARALDLQRRRPDRPLGVAKVLARRSEVLEQRGDVMGAIELLGEALAIDRDLYEAHFLHARLLHRAGRVAEAAKAEAAAHAAQVRVESADGRPR